jgi:hypothetical protein
MFLMAAGLFTACGGSGTHSATGGMAGMAPGETNAYGYMAHPAGPAMEYAMPGYAMQVPEVQEAYTFAVEHPEVLSYLPCSCGCEQMGHLSNWNCYVRGVSSAGAGEFEQHASGCQVCVDITLDAKAMWQRGSPLSEIRAYVDANYQGSMTQTELPPGS